MKLRHITGMRKLEDQFIYSKCGLVFTKVLPSQETIKSSAPPTSRLFQNCSIVWLDTDTNDLSNDDDRHMITALRRIVNSVDKFDTVNACVDFIGSIENETIFIVLSGVLNQTTISLIHDLPQVSSIYILSDNKLEYEVWIHKWRKIQNFFKDFPSLNEAIAHAAQECDRNTIPMTFIGMTDETSEQNPGKSDQIFMFTQVLSGLLSTIKFTEKSIEEFSTYYRKQLIDNVTELRNIGKFEREYHDYTPTWWYTSQIFVSSMLNRALRSMDVVTLIKMGFFIFDLQQYIFKLHAQQKIAHQNSKFCIVYRGQGISQKDFDQMKRSRNQLLSFNNFLCASKCRNIAMNYARQALVTPDLVGVLFAITIDRSLDSTPCATIRESVCYPADEDIIFSLNPVFRVGQLKSISKGNRRLWQVDLALTSNNDPQVRVLNERIFELANPHCIGWRRLSEFLINQCEVDKAQIICDTLITEIFDEGETAYLHYQYGSIKFHREEYPEAKLFYNFALDIFENIRSPTDIDVAKCYHRIGSVCEAMNDYSTALLRFEKALEMYEKNLSLHNPILIGLNKNIARVYSQIDNYSKSLWYYEKVLEINKNIPSTNDSDLASCYVEMALVYKKLGDYLKAISLLEKTISILEKDQQSNSTDIATVYNDIGSLYEKLNQNSTALRYFEEALKINETNLPPHHPDLAVCYRNIGSAYFQKADYLKALSFYQKAHELCRRILPINQIHLAISYTDQGDVYDQIGNYTQALLYYKAALTVYQNIDPLSHCDIITMWNKIGFTYSQTHEYSVALSCHERALEICRKNLPENHPDFAYSSICIGDVYDKMGDRLKALSFYKSALEIGHNALPASNICLEKWSDILERLRTKLKM
ncbi:unnamed protein product [Rotaria magnacalcarata]|uniref:Uncharacterized protein n=1 Tax=Rotaria magnacalcarata TaxID=392030 RepID=A0A816NQC5_9BILA|nr:unnamed protein product [Rotaria magnacalcarata]CAF2159010.1 unnamed protein product [Rotaria magnacalcarata]CAF3889106.1 unnamed protein product [Rotaria magnacalcarata]CAF3947235.1 unnamed protein product [Rotaria magnacalcarata]